MQIYKQILNYTSLKQIIPKIKRIRTMAAHHHKHGCQTGNIQPYDASRLLLRNRFSHKVYSSKFEDVKIEKDGGISYKKEI